MPTISEYQTLLSHANHMHYPGLKEFLKNAPLYIISHIALFQTDFSQ